MTKLIRIGAPAPKERAINRRAKRAKGKAQRQARKAQRRASK